MLGPSSPAFAGAAADSWIGFEQLGLELAPIGDVSTAGSASCTSVLTLEARPRVYSCWECKMV